MGQKVLKMNILRDVLRMKYEGHLTHRQIARACHISASTVSYYAQAAKMSPSPWSELKALSDKELVVALQPYCKQLRPNLVEKTPVDYHVVHQALRQKGETRERLWEEYRIKAKQPLSYPEFCRQYRVFKQTLKPSMRQTHRYGEKTFVDYAGPTVAIVERCTGKIQPAYLFVGVLGASNYTYVEATLSRRLPDWLQSHVRMYRFFGGVTALTVPDNEKSGVNHACDYDPDVNPYYAAMAAHYDTVIMPTRPGKPKDKAKVENAVQVVERWILAKVRHITFFTLDELNQTIATLLEALNNKPFQKISGSRRSHYEANEKNHLKPLPALDYDYVEIKKVQVRPDYHVEINANYYSVPYQLIYQTVQYQIQGSILDIFHDGQVVATHICHEMKGKTTTCIEHMPTHHRKHAQWTPLTCLQWAEAIAPTVKQYVEHIIAKQPHPERCYRIHLGLKKLHKRYGSTRFIPACQYAMQHAMYRYAHLRSILMSQIDQLPQQASNNQTTATPIPNHQHVRGAAYYVNPE